MGLVTKFDDIGRRYETVYKNKDTVTGILPLYLEQESCWYWFYHHFIQRD